MKFKRQIHQMIFTRDLPYHEIGDARDNKIEREHQC
jgi:hypothetical protein